MVYSDKKSQWRVGGTLGSMAAAEMGGPQALPSLLALTGDREESAPVNPDASRCRNTVFKSL